MSRARLLAVVLCLPLAAAEIRPELARTLDRISADSLRGHVSFLASDLLEGRDTPSPGLDIAAGYIAAQFRRAPLEPLGSGYLQTAHFVRATPDLEGFELSISAAGETVNVPNGDVSVENSGKVAVEKAKVFKVVLDSGSAPAAEQVRGKVLLVGVREFNMRTFEMLSRFRASVSKLNPAAVVILTMTVRRGSEARLRDAAEQGPPTVLATNSALRKIYEALPAGDAEAAVSLHIAAAKEEPVLLNNVAGLLRGSDPVLKDTYVIVSAHYDHIGVSPRGEGDRINNGADDNASGTAAVMELASAFSAMTPRPKRSIVFIAFFGEEKGLLGSAYYTRHPLVPLETTVADINLEELGRTDDTDGPQIAKLNMTGYGYSDLTPVFEEAGSLTGVEVPHDRQKKSEGFFGSSDNIAFARAGVPAHTFAVVYIYPDYHKPSDEWQKLDYDNMCKVTRTIAAALDHVAGNPQAPKWSADNPKAAPFAKAAAERK